MDNISKDKVMILILLPIFVFIIVIYLCLFLSIILSRHCERSEAISIKILIDCFVVPPRNDAREFIKFYLFFSILIRASTATSLSILPRSGLMSISLISGAIISRLDKSIITSANISSFTPS